MKKLSITLILCAMTITSFAQTFGFGPKAGVNLSNYQGGNIQTEAKAGYHFGGMLNFGFGNVFSIQPEVLFSTLGAKVESSGSEADFKINYLTVPVMLKFRTRSGFYLEAGPQAGFRLSESVPDQTIDHFAKNLDISLGGGLGYQTNIGLGIGVRYVAGLSKVGDFSSQEINPDFKNSVIQGSLFWVIPIVKE
ncbi:porin family protein [Dyadobacter jiangsuensis]|nr:porin family protein [Dyadobacter jiangsuensis]